MRLEFIHIDPAQNNNLGKGNDRRLILIFAGWGSDARLYDDIKIEGWDTAIVLDYRSLEFPVEKLDGYSSIYVYAWSMGVWAASAVMSKFSPDCSFAINGTGYPRHDKYGIPEKIYDGTLDTLNERNLRKFRLRMAGDRDTASRLDSLLPAPDISGLKEELDAIRALGPFPSADWSRAYISEEDRIFPTPNQLSFWKEKGTATVMIPGGHYPDIYKIVRDTVFNPVRVGERFGNALTTYDAHAHAQRKIAKRLTLLLSEMEPANNGKILEIGSGSGLFTSFYSPLISPASATYLDLYPMPRYNIAAEERYYIGDAEKWLIESEENGLYDVILSASTIQWFVSPRNFFRNAARLLRPGGVLAVSSFTKGNLAELDVLRPSPIVYRSARELKEMAEIYLDNVKVTEKDFTVTFPSPREALLHLKHTGVGGSASTGSGAAALMRKLPKDSDGRVTLTYRAVFITARKT